MSLTRCPNCMKELGSDIKICPSCGYIKDTQPKEVYHLPPGTMLNYRYEIGVVIGYGGFGVVYKAWDHTLDQMVAIKECYPTTYLSRAQDGKHVVIYNEKNAAAFQKMRSEFLEEARNIAKFNKHPNIVHIFDFFEDNGTAYFVMEYLDGPSLRKLIAEQRESGMQMAPSRAVGIAIELLSALKVAHAANIIHRDIKPANIIMLRDGTVKLFDFGSARFSDAEEERTRTAVVTPGYAPPEQYQTKSKQGPFTDIYAVGAVLYEMLTGVKPEESINRKVQDTVEPPHKLNKNVPVNVSNAVMRAMAIQPEVRFATVEQFITALEKQTGKVRDANSELKRRKRWRNLIISGIAVVLAILVGVVAMQYYKRYRQAVLAPAKIELWAKTLPGLDDELTCELYDSMAAEFIEDNPQIDLDISVYDTDTYEKTLVDAIKAGRGPDIFDSTGIYSDEIQYGSLNDLFEFSGYDSGLFYFLNNYKAYFPSGERLPLTFDVPVLYENTLNPGLADGVNYDAFIAGERDYLGDSNDLARIQEDMAGSYEILREIPEGKAGKFCNMWSVNEMSGDEEQKAAVRLLYYFLSDNAQEILTVENTSHMPLNRSIFEIYTEVNPDFDYLNDVVPNIAMYREGFTE